MATQCGNNFLGTQYGQVSPQLQFMHLMPYIDSVWFGEGYDYQGSSPAYWLVEVSGIPYGLMGDMMHEGHVWRGMVYGMTTRFRCADPTPLWRLWDSFGMSAATMRGYWEAPPPVPYDDRTCRSLATPCQPLCRAPAHFPRRSHSVRSPARASTCL